MQNFGRENFDDSTCIRQNSLDFSTVKVLRYTVVSRGYIAPKVVLQVEQATQPLILVSDLKMNSMLKNTQRFL